MARGRYSPDGLISRQAVLQLHGSRLIVTIPSQGVVRIPDEDEGGTWENGNIHASRSQIRSMHQFLRRLSRFGPLSFFPVGAIQKPRGY